MASVLFGAIVFSLLFFLISFFFVSKVTDSVERIGISGAYTRNNLPKEIIEQVSFGLTKVNDAQEIIPGIATSWKIDDEGKKYTFTIPNNLKLNNGKKFTVKDIPFQFKDVKAKVVNDTTIEYTLSSPFTPFLAIVAKPILIDNAGFSNYRISKISQEAGFVKEITLLNTNDKSKKNYYFYPTADALVTAFELGEVDTAYGVSETLNPKERFKNWKNVTIEENTQYGKLVALFFNTNDDTLSNKKLRQAIFYATPQNFSEGERTYSYIPPKSIYYSQSPNEGIYDLELSESLLDTSTSGKLEFEISTSSELMPIAKKLTSEWKKIGIDAKPVEVNRVPSNFQVFLYNMNLPQDPDMYTVWHSGQPDNLSRYKNVRIDKLLEDGRLATTQEDRISIYADVQKYLIDDSPAIFLYFPYEYSLKRK